MTGQNQNQSRLGLDRMGSASKRGADPWVAKGRLPLATAGFAQSECPLVARQNTALRRYASHEGEQKGFLG